MKKRIQTMIILAALLLSTATGCHNGADNLPGNNDAQETTPISDSQVSEPELERVDYFENHKLPFYQDKSGEYYIYVKDWDVYIKLPEMATYMKKKYAYVGVEATSAAIGEETATVAIYYTYGLSDSADICTYHLSRNTESAELYSFTMETVFNSEEDLGFINMYDEKKGYFFHMPGIYERHENTLIRYETNDGGKTWVKADEYDLGKDNNYHPKVIKMISKDIGIISFRCDGIAGLGGRTYLTNDGGVTWNKIADLPYLFEWDVNFDSSKPYEYYEIIYSDVYDLVMVNDRYCLTVEVHVNKFSSDEWPMPEGKRFVAYIQYWSADLENWN